MKQAGPEFLTGVEFNQEKVSQTGEFSTEPTFYNHLNRVRVSVTTPEHSLHRYTLTSELCARLWSFPWRVSLPCSDRKYQVSLISNPTNHLENKAQLCTVKQFHLSPSLGNSWERSQKNQRPPHQGNAGNKRSLTHQSPSFGISRTVTMAKHQTRVLKRAII